MAVKVDIRNPQDGTASYDQIEIQRNTANSASGMADIKTDLAISTTYASDLSTGYSSYTDADGVDGTHYYRFRYKNSSSGALSSYSDIFPASGSVLRSRFRRMMRDNNSNNYFFTNDDLEDFETQAIGDLYPFTWFETYDDSAFVPNGSTEIFTFPIGVTRVNKLEQIDSNGVFQGTLLNWKVVGKTIIFEDAPISGITIRAWVEKMFLKLGEVPEIWDRLLLNIMKLQAYETFEADRARYYKYTSVVKGEGGNLPSFDKIITRLEMQIQKRKNELRRVRRPQFIKLV